MVSRVYFQESESEDDKAFLARFDDDGNMIHERNSRS